MLGITEASITRRFCKPWTLSSSLTTLDLSVAGPIRQVPIRCQTVPPYWRAPCRISSSVRPPPRQRDAADHRALIDLVRQIVGLDRRIDKDVGRFRPHVANAFRPMLPDTAAHTRKIVEHADEAVFITRRRKRHLEVGPADVWI